MKLQKWLKRNLEEYWRLTDTYRVLPDGEWKNHVKKLVVWAIRKRISSSDSPSARESLERNNDRPQNAKATGKTSDRTYKYESNQENTIRTFAKRLDKRV